MESILHAAAALTWLRDVFDRLAPTADERQLTQIFQISARYKYLFWEIAYQTQDWPA